MEKSSERFKKFKIIIRLFQYNRPYKRYLVLIFVISLFSTLLSLVPTYMMKPLTDNVFAPPVGTPMGERIWMLHILIIALIFIYVVQNIISSVLSYRQDWLGEKIGVNLRNILYTHLQKLSLKFYNLEKTGELYSRVCYDTQALQYFIVYELLQLFIYIVMFFGIGAILFYLEWRLTILLLVPMPLIVILSNMFGERLIHTYRKLYAKIANMGSVVFNAIKGVVVVKTNVAEERELVRFEKANLDVSSEKLHRAKLNFLFLPLMGFILFLSGIVIRWLGGWQVIKGELTLGEMMVFIGYMWQFYGPVSGINSIYERYQNTVVAAERVFKLLDTEPEICDIPEAAELPYIQGNIRFDHVSFSYDGRKNVLEDISLEVKPGEIVGITGPNGAGKSTLVYLICHLYEATSGSIFIDGYDIRKVKLESLRNQIGLVLQDTLLFYGTIAENIAYGKPDASKMEIIFAAKACGAHDFIMRLPDAYDSLLGEGGVGLSGGEKQRISIARVLLRNPRIVIFDEATASVDLETQLIIHKTIKNLAQERTIFIVSLNPSMLEVAGKLIILEDGRIKEFGTYENLSKTGGMVSHLLKEEKLKETEERSSDTYVA